MELQTVVTPVQQAMREAGDIVMSYRDKVLTRTHKEEHGFATEADLASEAYLKKRLGNILPSACFLAEESGAEGTGAYCWVIDPLDGTTNFAQGVPHFSISVALTHNNKPVLGMTYLPILDELFHAVTDGGAFLNGTPIRVRDAQPADVLLGTGLAYSGKIRQECCQRVEKLEDYVYALRRMGSAAADLAFVAAGRFHASVHGGLAWWDVAAGIVLVQEAGGVSRNENENRVTPESVYCISGSSDLVSSISGRFFAD